MRIPRIYDAAMPDQAGAELELDDFGASHVSRVLRLKPGDSIRLFDGRGNEYLSELTVTGKKTVAMLKEKLSHNVESPVEVELVQVISRGDRMEFTLQKAVELGISRIIPLTSERCGVKLDADRAAKKTESWQRIAIAACEQCGRNVVPPVEPLQSLSSFVNSHQASSGDDASSCPVDEQGFINLTLDPGAARRLTQLPVSGKYRLLIGPEGGFTADEVELARKAGFTGITLGPRILRTETAALVCLSILGCTMGDL
ncbi:16S rRNA (uracil(1498)-N(3))-methyltransferase [Anaerobiospirillum sp. NML02-A-032]|uniref:16S rRNA (uracil(1498)-N(3))-methyltransferase n=2 Tax=unclassified Anaerobiospirillum TaxID=2647410 RepID=UPI001FF6BEFF|nr:16S rRNA (uracil(1498)-N(3))-methyltransferase [Anaerobiospirillum sp. NML02-A-032]MCK0540273.1 16S rRNA (uracil(1498)-N(3))-methyltransferase [Anaerobiospirillum sp. NML02-A-032]